MGLRLGELLIREKIITAQQLEEAQRVQVLYGGRLGTNLVELTYVSSDVLAHWLSKQCGFPFVTDAALQEATDEAIKLIPADVAEKFECFPLRKEGRKLLVAMVNPSDLAATDALTFKTGLRVVAHIVPELVLYSHLEKRYGIAKKLRYTRLTQRSQSNPALSPVGGEHPSGRTPVLASMQSGTHPSLAPVSRPVSSLGSPSMPPQVGFASTSYPSVPPTVSPSRSSLGGIPSLTSSSIPPTLPPADSVIRAPASAMGIQASVDAWTSLPPMSNPVTPLTPRSVPSMPPVSRPSQSIPPFPAPSAPPASWSSQSFPPSSAPSVPPASWTSQPIPPSSAPSPIARPSQSIPPLQAPLSQSVPPIPRPGQSVPPLSLNTSAQRPSQTPSSMSLAPVAKPTPAASQLDMQSVMDALLTARTREEVATALLSFAPDHRDTMLLFVVREQLALGWKGMGAGIDDNLVDCLMLPLNTPSIFQDAVQRRLPVSGPVSGIPLHGHFFKALGRKPPPAALVVPVVVHGHAVNLIYVDQTASPDVMKLAEPLYELAGRVAAAYVRILKDSKRAAVG